MARSVSPLAIAAIVAAVLLWSRRAQASVPINPGIDVYLPPSDEWWPAPDSGGEIVTGDETTSTPDYTGAFLYMIQVAETGQNAVRSGDAYRMLYGGALFDDLSDHPANLGWPGVRLSDSMCRAAGFGPGCVSTAAGAFQIIRPTWDRVRRAGAWGPLLPDFSPESQDEAARRILIECRALPYVESGNFDAALRLASTQWASLPGSVARQGPKSYETVLALYQSALGVA